MLQLITVPEAAEALGLCEKTIRHRIFSGLWPAYRLGRRALRVDISEIKATCQVNGDSQQRVLRHLLGELRGRAGKEFSRELSAAMDACQALLDFLQRETKGNANR